MTNKEMIEVVQNQLAIDLNCTIYDINSEKDSFIYCTYKDNALRRPFPHGESHFQMMTMGFAIIVSATEDILDYVKKQFENKSRDDAFFMPFVHGHSMYYLPDVENIKPLCFPKEFEFETVEKHDIPKLYEIKGFYNAIMYDINHLRPDSLVIVAKHNGKIVSMAGVSEDCEKLWQIGIDTLCEFRNKGLGAALVNALTIELINRDIVPYYGTASSNITSQKVAYRAGFMPAWMCVYEGNFENFKTSKTG